MLVNSRYQVAVLDPQGSGLRAVLEAALGTEVQELGLDPQERLRFLDAVTVQTRSLRDPVVGVYRGGTRQDAACTCALEHLRDAGADLLPLVDDLRTYPQSVPAVLHPINGMELDPTDPGLKAAVNRILEMLRLLRNKRRLFISYKRTESREAAVQLYDVLQQKRFDVFLDTHGVQTGDRVQDELGQRLLDADVMIFLDTTGATKSEWIKIEIEMANSLAIGVLQLLFPRTGAPTDRLERARFTELCEPLELFDSDFTCPNGPGQELDFTRDGGERLKPETLDRIATQVEALRARSMAARRNRLTARLLAALDDPPPGGLRPDYRVEPGRYITVRRPSGDIIVFPQVGIVDAPCMHRAEVDAGRTRVALLYDPTGLRPESQRHLEWLCGHTKIDKIALPDTEAWVGRP